MWATMEIQAKQRKAEPSTSFSPSLSLSLSARPPTLPLLHATEDGSSKSTKHKILGLLGWSKRIAGEVRGGRIDRSKDRRINKHSSLLPSSWQGPELGCQPLCKGNRPLGAAEGAQKRCTISIFGHTLFRSDCSVPSTRFEKNKMQRFQSETEGMASNATKHKIHRSLGREHIAGEAGSGRVRIDGVCGQQTLTLSCQSYVGRQRAAEKGARGVVQMEQIKMLLHRTLLSFDCSIIGTPPGSAQVSFQNRAEKTNVT